MPRRKPVLSLRQCCYQRIALSFDRIWMKDFDTHFRDMPRLMYAIGPFEDLTNEMIQSLINSLVEEKRLHRRHFLCLMQESIVKLDLSHADKAANNDAVIKDVAARCTKLTSLNLSGLRKVSGRALADLVEQRPSLKVLNLSKTNCNDQVLSVLGHHALGLLDLDVSSTPIFTSGILSLCQAFDKESKLGCKKLVKLNITATAVDNKGALHCLQNLPNLQYLGFEDVCGIIEMDVIERSGIRETYNLRSLMLNGLKVLSVTDTSIDLSCKMCPDAVEVKFFGNILPDKSIAILGTLKYLERLEIGQSGDSLTFEHGILPILNNIGDHLTALSLYDVEDIDLTDIAKKCRNIQELTLAISGIFGQGRSSMSRLTAQERCTAFSKLQHFTMICPFEEGESDIFKIMLTNARHLKSLNIHYMPMLSTELMLDVLKENPMQELQKLGFHFCHNIGPSVVDALLNSSNDLSEIELKDCKDIHRRDFERFVSFIKTCGFDLKIQWS